MLSSKDIGTHEEHEVIKELFKIVSKKEPLTPAESQAALDIIRNLPELILGISQTNLAYSKMNQLKFIKKIPDLNAIFEGKTLLQLATENNHVSLLPALHARTISAPRIPMDFDFHYIEPPIFSLTPPAVADYRFGPPPVRMPMPYPSFPEASGLIPSRPIFERPGLPSRPIFERPGLPSRPRIDVDTTTEVKPPVAHSTPKTEVKPDIHPGVQPLARINVDSSPTIDPPGVRPLFPATAPTVEFSSSCQFRRVVVAAGAEVRFGECVHTTTSICAECEKQKNFTLPLERTRLISTAKVTPSPVLDPARMAIYLFAAGDTKRVLFGTPEQIKRYDELFGPPSEPRIGFAHFEWSTVLKHMVVVAIEKQDHTKVYKLDEMPKLPGVSLPAQEAEVPFISRDSFKFEELEQKAREIAYRGVPGTRTSENVTFAFGYYPIPSVTCTPSFFEFNSLSAMKEFIFKPSSSLDSRSWYVGVLAVRRANEWLPVARFPLTPDLIFLSRPFEQEYMMGEMAKRLWAAIRQDDLTPFYRHPHRKMGSTEVSHVQWLEKLTPKTDEKLAATPFWGDPFKGIVETKPRCMGWKELEIKEIRLLGRGGFGDTWLLSVQDSKTKSINTIVAKAPLDSKDAETQEAFQKELRMLATLQHPNIVKCLGYIAPTEDGSDVRRRPAILLQYGGQDVRQFLRSFWTPVNLDVRVNLLLQIFEAVAHMHYLGVIHGDIKPSNFLVIRQEGGFRVALIDLGLATTTYDAKYTGGTMEFKAPELLLRDTDKGRLTMACDAYSLGVLMLEVLSDKGDPWRKLNRKDLEAKLRAGEIRLPTTIPSEAHAPFFKIAQLLLNQDTKERINVSQAKSLLEIAAKNLSLSISISPSPSPIVELNQKEMSERILQLAGFGSGPFARGITAEYFLDSVVCGVKFWPRGKTGITAAELTEHCKTYLGTAEFKMRGNTVYTKGLEKQHYEKLHKMYESDSEGKIGILNFIHIFLFLNRPLLSSQVKERDEPTLAEVVDLVYDAFIESEKEKLAPTEVKLHSLPPAGSLLPPSAMPIAPAETKPRFNRNRFWALATDGDLFAPRENAERLLAEDDAKAARQHVLRPTTGCVETVKGQYVSYGLNLVLSVKHNSGLFWHQLLVGPVRVDPKTHGGKAAAFVDSKGNQHTNLDFLTEAEIQRWRDRELTAEESTSSWSAARYRKPQLSPKK